MSNVVVGVPSITLCVFLGSAGHSANELPHLGHWYGLPFLVHNLFQLCKGRIVLYLLLHSPCQLIPHVLNWVLGQVMMLAIPLLWCHAGRDPWCLGPYIILLQVCLYHMLSDGMHMVDHSIRDVFLGIQDAIHPDQLWFCSDASTFPHHDAASSIGKTAHGVLCQAFSKSAFHFDLCR